MGEGLLALEGRAGFGLPGAALPFVAILGGADFRGESLGGSEGGSDELSSLGIFLTSSSVAGETDLTVLTLALEDKESLLEVRLILCAGDEGEEDLASFSLAFSLLFKGSFWGRSDPN